MNKLEPTYLRYVYDGLKKGSLNSDNASDLPQGFIGLFESEFSENISSFKRVHILKRLTLWALFKGPVSTHLVSEILVEDEEDTKALIETYSKWFNSPEPGKYVLYHDRLRTYFLQKLSSHEVQSLNEKLISYLEVSLKNDSFDEAQEYALEHLATHMAVESQLDNNYDRLHDFVNQEDLWRKQVRVSKEYKWSQQAVQYGIKESARRHQEMNTLTSTVNSVKLQQEEQNSAQHILDILNSGDYQTALNRALSFSKENQMTIFLLMIHELTFGSCRKLTKKIEIIDEIIDIISSNKEIKGSYPCLAIYKIHVELLKLGIDDKVILERLNFRDKALLHLFKYNNVDLEIHEELTNEIIAGGYHLVNINLIKAELLFNNNNNEKAKHLIEYTKNLVIDLKKEDGNDPYGAYNKEGSLRNDLDFITNKFNWLNCIFFIYFNNNCLKNAEKILEILSQFINRLENLIKSNIVIIDQAGANHLYDEDLAEFKKKYIECLIKLSTSENKYITDALIKIYNYEDDELDTVWISNVKELLLIEAMSKLFEIESTKKNNKTAFSFFKTHKNLEYQTEFIKLDSKIIQAKVTLKNCEFLRNENLNNEIKKAENLIDEIEYGVNTFLLLENLLQLLIEKRKIIRAKLILSKLEKRIHNLKNKNTDFYYLRIKNLVINYLKLNDLNGFIITSKKLIDVIISLEIDYSRKKNHLNSLMGDIRQENQNFYEEFSELLKNSEIYEIINLSFSYFKYENYDIFKILKCYDDFNRGLGIEDSIGFSIGNVFNAPHWPYFKGYKKVDFDLNYDLIPIILDLDDVDSNLKEYLLNILIENENYHLFKKKILQKITKEDKPLPYEIFEDRSLKIKENIPYCNYIICSKLISNKTLENRLKIIKSFNFPENPNPLPDYRSSLYPINNFTLISLLDYLSENISEKNIVLDKAYKLIDNFTSRDPNSIRNKVNNKLESYKFISKRLKKLGLNPEALIAIDKWKAESPKYIMNGIHKYRDYSGVTIDIISTLKGLITKNELIKLIDNFIEEHNGYTKYLLEVCWILKSLNEITKAKSLARDLHNMIDDDPFIPNYDRSENIALVNEFLYSVGDFNFADKIHLNLPDDYFSQPTTWSFSTLDKKSSFLIENNKENELVKLVKESFAIPENKRIMSNLCFKKIVQDLINSDKRDESIELLDFYKNEVEDTDIKFLMKSYWSLKIEKDFLKYFELNLINIIELSLFTNETYLINGRITLVEFLSDGQLFSDLRNILIDNSKPFTFGVVLREPKNNKFFNKNIFKSILTSIISDFIDIDVNQNINYFDKYIDDLYNSNVMFKNGKVKEIPKEDDFTNFDNDYVYSFVNKNANNIEKLNSFLNHKSEMVCFFEKDNIKEKLNLLSQVIDIDEWRKISDRIKLEGYNND